MKRLFMIALLAMVVVGAASCGGSTGVRGKVSDEIYGDPVPGLTVKAQNLDNFSLPQEKAEVGSDGSYSLSLEPGKYRLEIVDERSTFEYVRHLEPIKIENGWLEKDIKVEPIVKTWLHGKVIEGETKKPIVSAKITIDGQTNTTDKNGGYEFKYIRSGEKGIEITASGFANYKRSYRLSKGETVEDFEMKPSIVIEKAQIKDITTLLSYRVEIAKGTSKENVKESTKMIIVHMPFTFEVVSPNGEGRFLIMEQYMKKGEKWAKVDPKEFAPLRKIYDDYSKDFANIEKQFNAIKATPSKEPVVMENLNVVSYAFDAKLKGFTWKANFWIVYDGPYMGYPIKLVLEKPGDYTEFNMSMFNDKDNLLGPPPQ